MSNPEQDPQLEELAALHALGLLDATAQKELLAAADRDAEVARLVREFTESAALLTHEAPQIEPPPELKEKILRQLPARRAASKIIAFQEWIPYAVAAGLMILGIYQVRQILDLKSQLLTARADDTRLRQSNALIGLRLATLEARDASYASSKITVAWDPHQQRGVVALQNLPAPPAGHDYQLWVLDPGAQAPISAGVVTDSRAFAVTSVSSPTPGFAISLEPSGGSPAPTGPILFAVAPGP